MLNGLFGRSRAKSKPATPSGCVIWAIGDIHGRADLLSTLLDAIQANIAQSDAARTVVIFLGDYVDRGPDSRGVIDQLIAFAQTAGVEVRFLRGNHEDQFEAFLASAGAGRAWCEFGGRQTLHSYGVQVPSQQADDQVWEETSAALAIATPESHRRFLSNLELSIDLGDYFFSHAGARPGTLLERQSEQDLLWIRDEFLSSRHRFSHMIVHGHTPTDEVYADDRRIGIDTGAYATGVLTCLRLDGTARALIQTGNPRGRGI